MPLRRPLTADDLHRIQERYRRCLATPDRALAAKHVWRDVVTLLYEIKRMRAAVLRVYQLRAGVPRPIGCMEGVWMELMQLLEVEPCVTERDEWVNGMLRPKMKTPAMDGGRDETA